jgi:hypothetical protein
MRGYGGGPNHTSLHPRHWDSAKTVTFVPGIGYCRTKEAIPCFRRLIDAQIHSGEAELAKLSGLEKRIDGLPVSDRAKVQREVANARRGLEEGIATLKNKRASLGRAGALRLVESALPVLAGRLVSTS